MTPGRARRALRLAAAACGLLVTWCVCEGAAPHRTAALRVPPIYRTWYTAIVTCATDATDGIDSAARPFDALVWLRMRDSGRVLARYAPPDTIYLTDGAISVEWIVEHETLHYLTGRPEDGPPWAVCGVLDQDTWDAHEARRVRTLPPILRGAGA